MENFFKNPSKLNNFPSRKGEKSQKSPTGYKPDSKQYKRMTDRSHFWLIYGNFSRIFRFFY